jgi:hypothetical protein
MEGCRSGGSLDPSVVIGTETLLEGIPLRSDRAVRTDLKIGHYNDGGQSV